jgi:predicted PurR-regulated permease PerM
VSRYARLLRGRFGILSIAMLGLLVLASFYTLYFGKGFFLPVVVAMLLDRLLTPVVRFFRRLRIPLPLAAGLVLLLVVGAISSTVYYTSGPATRWIASAPENLEQAGEKLRGVVEPVERVQEAAREVERATEAAVGNREPEQQVTLESPSLSETLLGQTQDFVVGVAVTLFLLYFLLAAGDQFLRTFIRVLPHLRDQRKAVEITYRIEQALTTYLFTMSVINLGLGIAVGFAFYLLGMPNPVLWGMLVGLLNFVPYIGPITGIAIMTLVALVSFDTLTHALAVPVTYFVLNAIESYLVTPFIMGQRLTLNPVFIFLSLTFWGWIWGIPGALLAVPLLVTFKIVCDNIEALKPIGAFLGRYEAAPAVTVRRTGRTL